MSPDSVRVDETACAEVGGGRSKPGCEASWAGDALGGGSTDHLGLLAGARFILRAGERVAARPTHAHAVRGALFGSRGTRASSGNAQRGRPRRDGAGDAVGGGSTDHLGLPSQGEPSALLALRVGAQRTQHFRPKSARLTASVAATLLFYRFNRLGCAESDRMDSLGLLAAVGEG